MLLPVQDPSADKFAARDGPGRVRHRTRIVAGINGRTDSILVAQHDAVEFPTFEGGEFRLQRLESSRRLLGNRLACLPRHEHHGSVWQRHDGVVSHGGAAMAVYHRVTHLEVRTKRTLSIRKMNVFSLSARGSCLRTAL